MKQRNSLRFSLTKVVLIESLVIKPGGVQFRQNSRPWDTDRVFFKYKDNFILNIIFKIQESFLRIQRLCFF